MLSNIISKSSLLVYFMYKTPCVEGLQYGLFLRPTFKLGMFYYFSDLYPLN